MLTEHEAKINNKKIEEIFEWKTHGWKAKDCIRKIYTKAKVRKKKKKKWLGNINTEFDMKFGIFMLLLLLLFKSSKSSRQNKNINQHQINKINNRNYNELENTTKLQLKKYKYINAKIELSWWSSFTSLMVHSHMRFHPPNNKIHSKYIMCVQKLFWQHSSGWFSLCFPVFPKKNTTKCLISLMENHLLKL